MHLSKKTCHIFHLDYQGKLVKEKHVKENLLVCTVNLTELQLWPACFGISENNTILQYVEEEIFEQFNYKKLR